jgi:hypothetical protein
MAAIRTNGRNPKRRPLRGFGTMFITRRMARPSVFHDPNGLILRRPRSCTAVSKDGPRH